MKKLTLDETWRLCLRMWKWIAKEKKAGSRRWTNTLKKQWVEKHGYKGKLPSHNCFFCAFNDGRAGDNWFSLCRACPGRKVDKTFGCTKDKYHYHRKPIVFYNKLVSLNRKRLKLKGKKCAKK